MKLTISQTLLANALRRCTLGAGNSPNPVQQLVRLQAAFGGPNEPGQLTLSASNGLVAIEIILACDVKQEGMCATHCRNFATAANAMPLGELAVSTDEKKIRVVGKPNRRWSGGLAAEPDAVRRAPEPADAAWLRIPLEVLKVALESVEHATRSIEAHQPMTDGVFFEAMPTAADKGTLNTVVVTNHLMAAKIQENVAIESDKPWAALIPTRMLPLISDAIAEAEKAKDNAIDFFHDASYIYVNGSSTLLACVKAAGEFVPWRQVLDTYEQEPTVCWLPRLAMIESLKALQATASEDATARIDIADGALKLSGWAGESDFSDEVSVRELDKHTKATFGVKSGYLYSCLRAAGEEPALCIAGNGYVWIKTPSGYRQMICPRDLSAATNQPPTKEK